MSTGAQFVLGVDLDGVCADFYARMREIASEWFERPIDDLTPEVSYGLPEWGLDHAQYESLHRFAVTQRDLFKTAPMISGARRYLRKLSQEGFRIRIITHRLFIHYFHGAAVSQTIDWLDYHGIPYWDLCFMKEKDQVGADIYIEDNPENVDRLRSRGLYTSLLVEIDGERFTVAGSDDWAVLNVIVMAVRANPKLRAPEDTVEVTVGGTCEQRVAGEHHGMRWGDRTLQVGSRVCITVVTTAHRDEPIKRYRSDATVQESAYTDDEWKEMRYNDYLALRREFEPDA